MPVNGFELEPGEYICPACGQLYVPGVSTYTCPHDLTPEYQQLVRDVRKKAGMQPRRTFAEQQAIEVLQRLDF